jgi:hypothetical protein
MVQEMSGLDQLEVSKPRDHAPKKGSTMNGDHYHYHSRLDLLFGFDNGYVRGSWEGAVFRNMAKRFHGMIQDYYSPATAEEWKGNLGWAMASYLYVVPYFEKQRLHKPAKAGAGNSEETRDWRKGQEMEEKTLWIGCFHLDADDLTNHHNPWTLSEHGRGNIQFMGVHTVPFARDADQRSREAFPLALFRALKVHNEEGILTSDVKNGYLSVMNARRMGGAGGGAAVNGPVMVDADQVMI